MKRRIVIGLEAACDALDRLPTFYRDAATGKWDRSAAGLGCRLGVAQLSFTLDARWQTEVWKTP